MTAATLKEKIIPAILLAPSAHNTQPWRLAIGEDYIDIYVDWHRHLAVSDPTQRELYVSLGCTLTNGIVAAAHEGNTAGVTYFPQGERAAAPAARLTITSGETNAHLAALFTALESRRTNRQMYDSQPLTADERAKLISAQESGILLIEDRGQIAKIARLTEQGTVATLSRPDFKAELAHWVRNDWTRRGDGMPGYAMGVPAPLSLVSNIMVRLLPIHKQEGPKTRQQMESAAAVAVIATPDDSKTAWIQAGQLLEQLWLEATVAGLAAAPLAAGIEASSDIRNKLQQVLTTNLLPQAILRLGHSKQKNLRATPRRELADCLR
ncbi:MAG: nitroreductase family protein [Candidatus Andersenbacteria bacterium]